MQLFTSLPQINALPASDLKTHLQARHRALYEDGLGPVFVIVQSNDQISGPDYAFISESQGLVADLWGEHEPGHPQFCRVLEWAAYLPAIHLYESLVLINGEDGYWLLIPETIVEANPDLKWILTDESQGGLSEPQPL